MEGLEIRQFLLVPVIYCICELSIFLEFEGLKMLSPNSVSEILRVSKCLTERCLTFGIYCTQYEYSNLTAVHWPSIIGRYAYLYHGDDECVS